MTFADIAGLIIGPPPVSYFTPSDPAGVGSGAPNELGTNVAYGFNWIFGDTLSNYVSGVSEGYIVSNASASAVVPIPGAAGIGMLGMGLVSVLRRRKNIAA